MYVYDYMLPSVRLTDTNSLTCPCIEASVVCFIFQDDVVIDTFVHALFFLFDVPVHIPASPSIPAVCVSCFCDWSLSHYGM